MERNTGLTRQLGLFDSTMMMVGIVIGSGIFVTTGIMAKNLPSAWLILLAWLVGGGIVLCGALTYAELGAALPQAGGQYIYLKEAYGSLFGFLFGWKMFLVSMGGAIAALAAAFAEYVAFFVPSLSSDTIILRLPLPGPLAGKTYNLNAAHLVAVGVIGLITLFNYVGVNWGKIIQNLSTVIKMGAIGLLIVLGLLSPAAATYHLQLNPLNIGAGDLLFGFGLALVAVFWAFDGWNNINYIAGEIKQPGRNIPRTLIRGTLIITTVYFLVNLVYLLAMPVAEMAGVVRIAERAAFSLYGSVSASILSAAVLISIFGALNGAIFVGPRVYYAMAADGLFFKQVGRIHPRFNTPGWALIFQAAWASLLALSGSFEQLFTFTMFMNILFWVMAAAAVFTLRRTRPDMTRPYRTWGYPITPLLFILALSGVMANSLVKRPLESLAGLLLALLGIPIYFLWKKQSGSKP